MKNVLVEIAQFALGSFVIICFFLLASLVIVAGIPPIADSVEVEVPRDEFRDGHVYEEIKVYDSLWGGYYYGKMHSPNCWCRNNH